MAVSILLINIFAATLALFSILNKKELLASGKLSGLIISFFSVISLIAFVYFISVITGMNEIIFLSVITLCPVCFIIFSGTDFFKLFKTDFLQILNKRAIVVLLLIFVSSYIFTGFSQRWGAGWDAFAIWDMHAKFLIFENSWRNYLTNTIAWSHPDYPLMLSSYIAMFWRCMGSAQPIVPAIIAYIVFLAIPLSAYSSFKSNKFETGGILFFILVCVNYNFISRAASQYADSLLGLFYLLPLMMMYFSNNKNADIFFLAGFFAALCGWIKNEGLLYFFAFSFYVIVANFRNVTAIKKYILGSLIPLVMIFIFKSFYAPANDLAAIYSSESFYKLMDAERYKTIIVFFCNIIVSDHFFLLPVIIILIFFQRSYFKSFGFKVTITVLAGYFLIYLLTPLDLNWHLESSFTRLFHQLYPSFLYSMIAAFRVYESPLNRQVENVEKKYRTWIENG